MLIVDSHNQHFNMVEIFYQQSEKEHIDNGKFGK